MHIPLSRDDGGQSRLSRSSCRRVYSVRQCPQLFGNAYLNAFSNVVVSATSIDDPFIANQHLGKHREAAHLQNNDVVGFSARNLFASSTLTQGRPSGQLFSDIDPFLGRSARTARDRQRAFTFTIDSESPFCCFLAGGALVYLYVAPGSPGWKRTGSAEAAVRGTVHCPN